MTDLAFLVNRQPGSAALLESAEGTELLLRGEAGGVLCVPIGDPGHLRGLAALATMVGALGSMAAKGA